MARTDADIAAMTDPVLRNLLITQRYHELAVDLRNLGLGDDASWCAFAVWASKTAGASIRGEVLPWRVAELLDGDGNVDGILAHFNRGIARLAETHLSRDHIGQIVASVTTDVSRSVASGNVLVFAELAPLFGALVEARPRATSADELSASMAGPLGTFGDTQNAPVVDAFDDYIAALFAPEQRAHLVLRANTLAVAHEQQRLQPAIAQALDAAVTDTLKKVLDQLVPHHIPRSIGRRIESLVDDLCSVLDRVWDTALTESLMQLAVATDTFDLRKDVPPFGPTMFPAALSDLTGSPAQAAVAQWDRTEGTGRPSGAHDWAVLEQRMNYIVNLFRAHQQNGSLFNPPFDATQTAALLRGEMPTGPL